MLSWLAQNIVTVIICAVLIAIVSAIIVHLVKNKKNGKSSCGCGCTDCPMSSSCHPKK